MAAVRADPQGAIKLVVAIVGVAARAGVRMLLPLWLRRVAVLDRDVDPGRGHRPILDCRPFRTGCSSRESPLQTQRRGQLGQRLDVRGLEAEPAEAGTQDARPAPDLEE